MPILSESHGTTIRALPIVLNPALRPHPALSQRIPGAGGNGRFTMSNEFAAVMHAKAAHGRSRSLDGGVLSVRLSGV